MNVVEVKYTLRSRDQRLQTTVILEIQLLASSLEFQIYQNFHLF